MFPWLVFETLTLHLMPNLCLFLSFFFSPKVGNLPTLGHNMVMKIHCVSCFLNGSGSLKLTPSVPSKAILKPNYHRQALCHRSVIIVDCFGRGVFTEAFLIISAEFLLDLSSVSPFKKNVCILDVPSVLTDHYS